MNESDDSLFGSQPTADSPRDQWYGALYVKCGGFGIGFLREGTYTLSTGHRYDLPPPCGCESQGTLGDHAGRLCQDHDTALKKHEKEGRAWYKPHNERSWRVPKGRGA